MTSNVRRQVGRPRQDKHLLQQAPQADPLNNQSPQSSNRDQQAHDDDYLLAAQAENSTSVSPTLISIEEVMRRVSIGRTMTYELIKRGSFPKPVKIGNASRWLNEEITKWIRELAEERDLCQH